MKQDERRRQDAPNDFNFRLKSIRSQARNVDLFMKQTCGSGQKCVIQLIIMKYADSEGDGVNVFMVKVS